VVAEFIHSKFRACTENFETACVPHCSGGFPVGEFRQNEITHWMNIPDTPFMQQEKERFYK
jgi:hypothetical protein